MDDLRELYQATILDHNKTPRNFGELPGANRTANGDNPICGDKLAVHLAVDDQGRVVDVRFDGKGCAISTASASLMTEFVKGRGREEIDETFERFHTMVTGNPSETVDAPELGKLAVFSGVREYPVRVKCATLCWHTLRAALAQADETVRTE
ncbi:MAG: SUF system NifU family Fe-S cluster assembly protein [Myxococcota bacterium]